MGRGRSRRDRENRVWLLVLIAAALSLGLALVVAAGAASRPDLKVQRVAASNSGGAIGSRVAIGVTTTNTGRQRAPASLTRFYLSLDKRQSRNDRVLGSSRVAGLSARKSARRRVRVTIPRRFAPGRYRLLACADATRKTKEASERNNCRAASRIFSVRTSPGPSGPIGPPGRVTNPTGDDDGDGFTNARDCNPKDPNVNPNAEDLPDVPGLKDSNCDAVDGNASKAIFAAPTGNDASPGTRGQPKRTLAGAIAAAGPQGKSVYAAGAFPERLDVANGVSVYGGYAADWSRSQAAASETLITGAQTANRVEAALASATTAPTTLQLLALAPRSGTGPGTSSYGLRAIGSPGLVLEYLRVTAGSGTAGAAGAAGANGRPGGAGQRGKPGNHNGSTPDGAGGFGGTSPVGRTGGGGGRGGYSTAAGQAGSPGLDPPDTSGRPRVGGSGGPGGPGGASGNPGRAGGPGQNGDSGVKGRDGTVGSGGSMAAAIWTTAPGGGGLDGTNGHGGGGGGGGGGQTGITVIDGRGDGGGGGGGGGEGGRGGLGGKGGGGSFGIVLLDSTGAVISNSMVTAGKGGAGGGGGAGGRPGAGGPRGPGLDRNTGEIGAGARGGLGGVGGLGGNGGGGAGGPSVALYVIGSTITSSGNTLRSGAGGAGGRGAGASGAAGIASAQLTVP
jgi:CARDB